MDPLTAFLINNPHAWQIFAITWLIYFGRYFITALLGFALLEASWRRPWGHVPLARPAEFSLRRNAVRELGHSVVTTTVFALIGSMVLHPSILGRTQMYFGWHDYSMSWFVASIVLSLIAHDTLFYWAHRLMHTPQLFAFTHRTHHDSRHPTAFAAYSFHVGEAIIEALITVVIIFLFPIHPLAFAVFQGISTAYNVYGHSGRELYPENAHSHPVYQWMNTARLHGIHHHQGRGNYGLYFSVWDRLMGTLRV